MLLSLYLRSLAILLFLVMIEVLGAMECSSPCSVLLSRCVPGLRDFDILLMPAINPWLQKLQGIQILLYFSFERGPQIVV